MTEQTNTSTRFTITDAAKLVGMSRQNIHKTYIKTGILSVSKDEQGRPYIDLSELLRVFPSLKISEPVTTGGNKILNEVASVDTSLQEENQALRAKIDAMSKELAREKERAERAEDGEKWARSIAEKTLDTVKLLEHKNSQENISWFAKFFKKS